MPPAVTRSRAIPGGLAATGLASVIASAEPGETARRPEPSAGAPPVIITEILANVPAGMEGDANADGVRDAAGDEFVELYNDSDSPVSLRGWTISNRRGPGGGDGAPDPDSRPGASRKGVHFTFPSFDLPPRAVAVVFNGYQSRIPGPAGDEAKAPAKPNDRFGGAWVFVMDNDAKFNAFNNAADFVLLADKSGRPVECIVWGKPDVEPPAGVKRLARVKGGDPKGSLAREPGEEGAVPHRRLDGRACSPGVVVRRDAERESPGPRDGRPREPGEVRPASP